MRATHVKIPSTRNSVFNSWPFRQSCSGISFKSQALYLIVYVTRYLGKVFRIGGMSFVCLWLLAQSDLFWTFGDSSYNSLMKLVFISSSAYTLYLMVNDYKPTHDPNIDTFKVEYLLGGSAILAILLPSRYALSEVSCELWKRIYGIYWPLQILWTFSIWLEAVAILPQLFMLQRTGEAETITTHYLFALGAYRALYIPNWIYRYIAQDWHDSRSVKTITIVAGIIQTILYSDFFWIYYTKWVPRFHPKWVDSKTNVIKEFSKGRNLRSLCRYRLTIICCARQDEPTQSSPTKFSSLLL